jgi:PAS domain S-box-containing protein
MNANQVNPIILAIDDNVVSLGVLTGCLREQGFQIIVARSGHEGLEKARADKPDLILLDVMMPDIDGFETCHRLKTAEDTKDIPVIFITALQDAGDKVKGFAAGGVDYITKPLQKEEMLARIKTHLQLQAHKKQLQQEIAERQRKEEALNESEMHYRTLLDKLPDAVFIHDITGKLFDINEEACRRLGYSREELLQKHPKEFTQEKPQEGYAFVLSQLRTQGRAIDTSEHITKTGARIPCEIAMNLIQYKGQPMILSISRDITEHRQAAEKVQQQNEFLQHILESLSHPFYVVNVRDYSIVLANSATPALGADGLNTCYARTHKTNAPCNSASHQCPLEILKQTKKPVILEHIHIDQEGRPKNVEVHGFPIFNQAGELTQMIEYSLDITERKQVEAKLRDSERQYRTLAENSGTSILIINREGVYQFMNHKAAAALGGAPADFIGKSVSDLFPPTLAEEILAANRAVIDTGIGRTYEQTYDLPTGKKTFLVNDQVIQDAQGKGVALQSSSIDITEHKKIESALSENENRLRTIFEASHAGIILVDPSGIITFANQRMADLFKCSLPDVLGSVYSDHIHPDEKHIADQKMQQLIAGEIDSVELERNYLCADGSDFWGLLSGRRIEDDNSQLISLVGLITDISERKQIESQREFALQTLRQSEERYRRLVDNAPVGIFSFDMQGRIVDINPKILEILGSPSVEATKALNVLTFPPLVEAGIATDFRHSLETGESGITERFYQTKWNKAVYGRFYITPLTDTHSALIGAQVLVEDITARRQAETQREEALAELRQEYRRLDDIIDFLPDATLVIDQNRRVVAWNRAMEAMTGIPKNDILGQDDLAYSVPFYGEKRPILIDLALLPDAEFQALNEQSVRREGDLLFAESNMPGAFGGRGAMIWGTAARLRNPAGELVGAIESIRDITELKRAEETLRESEAKFRSIIEQSRDGFLLTDEQGIIIEWNEAQSQITGLGRESALGKLIWEVQFEFALPERRSPELYQGLRAMMLDAYKNKDAPWLGLLRENEIQRLDGSRRVIQTVAYKVMVGDKFRIGNFTHDITERKEAEEALSASETKFRWLAENVQDIIWLTDLDLRFTYVSPAVTRVLGYTLEEAMQISLPENLTPASLDVIMHAQAQRTQSGVDDSANHITRLEIQQYHKNGNLVWMEMQTQPIFDEQGKRTGYLGVSRNIDERKEYERQLQQAKETAEAANRAKSAFLANMSHELRTPLNAILGFSEFVSRADNLTSDQRENLSIINRSGEHLLQIINDILEISKIEAGRSVLQEEIFDLPDLLHSVENILSMRAQQQGVEIVFDLAPDMPRSIRADQGKLRQILMNLLSNAIKFAPNGRVTLSSRVDPANPKYLLFAVEDTGVGIAPEEIDLLFNTFSQTSSGKRAQQGTGLGLAISRAFVQLMGGEITANSQIGQGSRFEFNVLVSPLSPHDTRPMGRAKQPRVLGLKPGQQAPDGGPYRMLVVEDVDANRLLIENVLGALGKPVGANESAACGFEIRSARNGQEAIELWKTWNPHLIWMDIRMPVMDGYEAARYIKAQPEGHSTVIIAMTATAFEEDRLQTIALGFSDFVRKPFREKYIVGALVEQLGIQFIYEDDKNQPLTQLPPAPLIPAENETEPLPTVPAAWLDDARKALTQGDIQRLRALTEQIRSQLPALSKRMTQLIENFEMDELGQLIQSLPTGDKS